MGCTILYSQGNFYLLLKLLENINKYLLVRNEKNIFIAFGLPYLSIISYVQNV